MTSEQKNKKLNIVLPAYNEEKVIGDSTERLSGFCRQNMTAYDWKIIVADNGSTDKTADIVRKMEKDSGNKIVHKLVSAKGKGLAVREGWQSFDADVYVFMDADLSTDLSGLPALTNAIEQGYDLAVGSRMALGSVVRRSLKRKIISKVFSLLVRRKFGLRIKDYPCGFKAANNKIVRELLPLVKNNTWFFDTEMIIRAAKKGYKIKEIPVKWTDTDEDAGRESKADLKKIIKEYLKELKKLKADLPR
ncbi:MAG: glycosyltransferase [Candidatus Pacebacteria bacterium]|nr:glycosyltransferase [Candidatus Paceibacterota bacterium]NUQ57464.1 glycosyltransferase [Candidatus Paceibacter sp.]